MVNTWELMWVGLVNSFTPYHILLIIGGLAGGIFVGTLPGLAAIMGITLMMPFTFAMDPASGLVMLGAIYCGGIYGGANASILLNTPGTPAAICTTFDGWPMTKKGRGSEALFGSLAASVIGGLIGTFLLVIGFAPLAKLSLEFGPPEFFWLTIFGLSTIAAMSSGNIVKGLLGGAIGLFVTTIGLDPFQSTPRFNFGFDSLILGIDMVPVVLGVFCFAQMLVLLETNDAYVAEYQHTKGVVLKVFRKFFKDCKINLIRSSIIGTLIGMLPGAGACIASLISYNEAKRWDKNPGRYGTGVMEGIVASEAANNAMIGGSLVPMLALGIPGSAIAAVIQGGLLAHGMRPGSQLLLTSGEIAYTFIMSLILSNILMLFVGYYMIKLSSRILKVPNYVIIPTILVLSVIGSYSIRNSMFDVKVMFVAGILGYLFSKLKIDAGPIALGIVLGPIAENNLGLSLMLAETKPSLWHVLVFRPISTILIVMCILSVMTPLILEWKNKKTSTNQKFKCNTSSCG